MGRDAVQKLQTKLLVRHLAAAEAQGDLHLVAFAEEFQHGAHLHIVIVGIGPGTELDLLDLDDVLLLAGLGLAFLLLVLELAEVHDLADRRFRVRRDLDKIKTGLFGHHHGTGGGDDSDVLAIGADQSDLGAADSLVDTGARFALRRGVVGSAGYGGVPCAVGNCAAQAAAEETEDAAAQAASDAAAAADAATAAASDAAAAAAAATEEAARTAGEAASSAADAAVEAAKEAAAAATLAARNAADAAGELLPEDLLRVETFDRARVDAMIDSSDLDPSTKERLKNTIDAAQSTPELLGPALETVRTSLGFAPSAAEAD